MNVQKFRKFVITEIVKSGIHCSYFVKLMTHRLRGVLLADIGIYAFHVGIESRLRLVFVFIILFLTFRFGFVRSISARKYDDVALAQ